jgi:hypothetical protein
MSTNPPSKFATGIKSVHALQSILLWAFINGTGLDSCWRHKNENRAPVTFITTIDQNNRILPGMLGLGLAPVRLCDGSTGRHDGTGSVRSVLQCQVSTAGLLT